MERSEVYRVECGECKAVYIGQMGRNLRFRVREHVSKGKKSAFGDHLVASSHKFEGESNVALLHQCKKGRVMDRLEEIEIIKHRMSKSYHLLNDITFTFLNGTITRMYSFSNDDASENVTAL